MHQLEGFKYVTVLYLYMGYYTIILLPASQDMTMIVTEFGTFRYNNILIEMCAPGGIFQAKAYELLGDIEGVKTYIGDILVLSKY